MRVRLFTLGQDGADRILWLDSFPITLSEDEAGSVRAGECEAGRPLCVLDEQDGNLVFVRHNPGVCALVNADPIERGGLAPGDVLSVGERRFLVSYERTTSRPLPRRKYHIATAEST
jgi:hypothetical protein